MKQSKIIFPRGWRRKQFWIAAALGAAFALHAETITVKTRAPENRSAVFQYRIPNGYDPQRPREYRVLVIFGGRNTDGKDDASGRLGWGPWADRNGIFIVAPGFRNDNYWQPREWSGRALEKALEQLRKQYRVCTSKLLFYGYSAGSQASNLFPAARPDRCRAWVSHACGVFHEPSSRMRGVPGLVTCGDADKARYIISRNFVEKSRGKGVNIVWKSFPNHPHDVPPASLALARAFLEHYHAAHPEDLAGGGRPPAETEPVAFVGDDQEQLYYPADSPQARNVIVEDRVELPTRKIADAWGNAAL